MPVAIVTGASRGFGRAVARQLAEDGWALVIDARAADALEAAEVELRAMGAPVRAVTGDVTDAQHRRSLVAAADALGGLELVVASAGALGPSPLPRLADLPLDALGDVLAVNAIAQLGLVQEALPSLRRARGAVVAVTSDAAVEAYEGWGAYGASKAALEQLHHVLAVEEPDVRVYRFDPGDMRTQMHQEAFPGEDISDRAEPAGPARALGALVRGRRTSGRYRAAELLAGGETEVPAEVPA